MGLTSTTMVDAQAIHDNFFDIVKQKITAESFQVCLFAIMSNVDPTPPHPPSSQLNDHTVTLFNHTISKLNGTFCYSGLNNIKES